MYLMGSTLVLGDPLGALAALSGGQLGHSDLAVPCAHGQAGVSAVRQKLCLEENLSPINLYFRSLYRHGHRKKLRPLYF